MIKLFITTAVRTASPTDQSTELSSYNLLLATGCMLVVCMVYSLTLKVKGIPSSEMSVLYQRMQTSPGSV
jgi:hypothetical protein